MRGGLIEVARAYLPHEALLAVALLQAEGIFATTFDMNTHATMPAAVVALGGIRVMVPAADAERAAALLDAVPQTVSHFRPAIVVVFIALSYFSAVPPIPSGLFVRRPQIWATAGP